ncbi:unnamed protein product, partial [Polarella glacialis]
FLHALTVTPLPLVIFSKQVIAGSLSPIMGGLPQRFQPRSRHGPLLLLAFAGLLAAALRSSEAFASSRGNVAGARLPRFLAPQRRLQVAVFGSDTFDPWTVLGISTQADKEE